MPHFGVVVHSKIEIESDENLPQLAFGELTRQQHHTKDEETACNCT